MEKLTKYRNYVKNIITEYSQYKPSYGDIEVQVVFDEQRDHYQLLNVGWHGNRRVRGCVLQIDIKNEKIWIQHDGTEIGIANELLDLGVPKSDIILAFHAPYKRKYTGFAVS
ncbi:fatty-acid oxidation protein subunit alpha [Hydrocoleum sp. CS-953]|uniref:XisI protein n=1 Tax=Hydrocoleum sp. CS-953 TaxID=1671698 RepID=UPI000B9B34C4|nr:XisI protein [Hydrocoleum sp. CS-953]OZH51431.1 fatty-acid oxidation protein subunit alpha [Hydrocoleum sp. CS-953]